MKKVFYPKLLDYSSYILYSLFCFITIIPLILFSFILIFDRKSPIEDIGVGVGIIAITILVLHITKNILADKLKNFLYSFRTRIILEDNTLSFKGFIWDDAIEKWINFSKDINISNIQVMTLKKYNLIGEGSYKGNKFDETKYSGIKMEITLKDGNFEIDTLNSSFGYGQLKCCQRYLKKNYPDIHFVDPKFFGENIKI